MISGTQTPESARETRAVGSWFERVGETGSRIGSLRPSHPGVRRGVHFGIAAVVLFAVALAAIGAVDRLDTDEWRLNAAWLPVAVLGFAALQLCHAELWRRVLGALGPHLGVRRSLAVWCPSILGRYVPTSLLMPVVRAAMAESDNVPKRVCLASVVYELALAFTGALAVSAYFLIDLPALDGKPERFLALALPVAALVLLHPRIFHTFADRALARLGRAGLPRSLSFRRVIAFVVLYGLSFLLAGLALWALVETIYPVPANGLLTVVVAFAVGYSVSLIAFILPGGLGAREAGLTAALAPVLPTELAVGIAVAVRILQILLELLFAAVTPLLLRR